MRQNGEKRSRKERRTIGRPARLIHYTLLVAEVTEEIVIVIVIGIGIGIGMARSYLGLGGMIPSVTTIGKEETAKTSEQSNTEGEQIRAAILMNYLTVTKDRMQAGDGEMTATLRALAADGKARDLERRTHHLSAPLLPLVSDIIG